MFIRRILIASVFAGAVVAYAPLAGAQIFDRPPGGMGGAQTYPAQTQDAAGLLVRVDRLENQIRSQNGQIEQMQFQMQRLQDQLRKFQQDVDFRFDERKPAGRPAAQPPQRRGDAADDVAPAQTDIAAAPRAPTAPAARVARRADAFDPAAAPDAPGAPQQLGSLGTASRPLPAASGARGSNSNDIIDDDEDEEMDANLDSGPLDLDPRNTQRRSPAPPRQSAAVDPSLPPALPRVLPPLPQQQQPAQGRTPQGPLSGGPAQAPQGAVAALPPQAGPRAEYDTAMIAFKAGQFEDAQNGLEGFLRKYPKDRMASEAVFYLGESFARRGRNREAAEQYLKFSTDYASASRAPESMVKLGQSLQKLGLKEQACATFSEVPRKYPTMSAALRQTADREQKRNQC